MNTLSPELLAGMGEFFARKPFDMENECFGDERFRFGTGDVKDFAAFGGSCKHVHSAAVDKILELRCRISKEDRECFQVRFRYLRALSEDAEDDDDFEDDDNFEDDDYLVEGDDSGAPYYLF